MMKTYFRALFILVLASAGIAQASVVYNNTATDTLQSYLYSAGAYSQIGDTITLGGTDRTLTDATVQFFNLSESAGTFSASLRFWNTGAPVGSQIGSTFTVNSQAISSFGIANVTFAGLNLVVPNSLVFTVSVANFGFTDLGLNAFEPPSVGSSDNAQIITRDASTFSATATTAGQGNLYLLLNATTVSTVPEPSTLGLSGVAVIGLLAARRRRPSGSL